MTPDTFQESTLFATQNGSVSWAAGNRLRVALRGTRWVLVAPDLSEFQDTVEALVQQAAERRSGYRWRVRVEGNPPVTLTSHEVRQLSVLLEGALTMLELEGILDDAGIESPGDRVQGG